MRKIAIIMMLIISIPGFSQFVADPTDKIYEYITIWEGKGYVYNLPLLRPYPHVLIKQILEAVMENGDSIEQELARSWYNDLFFTAQKKLRPDRIMPQPFGIHFTNEFHSDFGDYLFSMRPNVTFQDQVTEWFSFAGYATMGPDFVQGDPAPAYTRVRDDGISGGAYVDLGGIIMEGINNTNAMIFFGNPDLYLQGGISRSAFGPFWDNSGIIGSHAHSAGHLSFTWNPGWGCFTSVLLMLNPKYVENQAGGFEGTPIPISSSPNTDLPVEKYLILHSWSFRITDWFTFTLAQAEVFGARFVWAYLFPLQHLSYTQMLMGDVDSSYISVITEFNLPANLELNLLLYIDDFNMNKFLGGDGALFDLNSAQNKVAMQAGLAWAPKMEMLRRMELSYFMVTPYTYTHAGYNGAPINYLNYTHENNGLGTMLSPNSDRIAFTAFLQPATWCDVKVFSYFMRHGNASDGVLAGDGSYWDDGRDPSGTVFFYGASRFLTQSTIEKIFQIGFNADFRFSLGFGKLLIGAGYTFEYGWDRELVPGAEGARNIFSFRVGIDL